MIRTFQALDVYLVPPLSLIQTMSVLVDGVPLTKQNVVYTLQRHHRK